MAELYLSDEGPLDKLIAELEVLYPQVDPSPDDDWGRVLYRSGQHSVVQYIKSKLEN